MAVSGPVYHQEEAVRPAGVYNVLAARRASLVPRGLTDDGCSLDDEPMSGPPLIELEAAVAIVGSLVAIAAFAISLFRASFNLTSRYR